MKPNFKPNSDNSTGLNFNVIFLSPFFIHGKGSAIITCIYKLKLSLVLFGDIVRGAVLDLKTILTATRQLMLRLVEWGSKISWEDYGF